MKINVHDIQPAKPRRLVFDGHEGFLKEILERLVEDDPAPAAKRNDAVSATLTLTRDGKTVHVEGEAHATIHPPCARCLKPVTTALDPQIALSLLPARAADVEAKAEDVQLADEELDDYTYSNDEIDVGAILNEQLLLERPFRILCSEDCKGLCPNCGLDLNESLCTCAPQPKSLAFAALKDFKPRN
ncbi:MAG TPA: DUF177 domain-containing protein [bacterium]|nr:DUF177 domain-containing protein [bacterium]